MQRCCSVVLLFCCYQTVLMLFCSAQCRPGTYSKDGLEICRTCLTGFYQTDYAKTECHGCQAGYSTLLRGANSVEECKAECQPGRTSETGLEPCFPCPKGYFQAESGTEHCYKCPNKVTYLQPCHYSIFITGRQQQYFKHPSP